ncbi:hypothetical protein DYQ86_12895 [Acidobacteria bacterium AB60]|nr:hypothetical protein DYQ86_12895 [Acidobacteria bacterium AB60]
MAHSKSSTPYWFALLLETALLYSGFSLLLASMVPPVYRLIGTCVSFPLAGVAAWWGGHIALLRRGEKHYHYMQLFETLPVRAFIGLLFIAIVLAIVVVISAFQSGT